MHARTVRSVLRSTALAGVAASTLAWAPAATALSAEPTPSSAATETPDDAGSVAITKKDPSGDAMQGATFLLLDDTGQTAGTGKTDAQGKLTFTDLAPGVYRLNETASGSPLHDVAADQDVIVTPGATAPVTVIDPFKPAHVTLKAKDNKTGKALPGSTVNIGTGDKILLTLTTGPKGTASGDLPISSRVTEFWARQTKAPAGYALYKPSKTFSAGPGAPVTVTVTNSKTTTGSSPAPTQNPTGQPTSTAPAPSDSDATSRSATDHTMTDTDSSPADGVADGATPKTRSGSLAHTGTDATPWLLGGAGLLVVGGIAAVVAARTRRSEEGAPSGDG
ncbi:SpaA isopeptide-forming pilin-related protein [Streptomyces prunicolor]|uniref:SpaA isopeptide-forming pilin-related protein n=1 Tax=Streptomyces prunicolor TaxID=67348 RepID=UPI00225B1FB2|nr:SpaA isopeptide-forming pilin-related protein [Streptomyces prunicolor]MCX5238921.1 SpaA isopeptide-forming pilin-related protein [Streptomyces prunicolor]